MNGISPYLIAIVSGWIVAQGAKYIIMAIRHRSLNNFRQLYLSGNMPSAHSATTVALTTVIGLDQGIASATFAVAAMLSGIVMYDAVMVRRSVGEQGQAIQEIIRTQKLKNVVLPRAAKGHTPLEVVVGAIVGVIIGFIVFFATR